MEVFGILLSLPGAFVATSIYHPLLVWAHLRWALVRRLFLPASVAVIVAMAAEWALLLLLGAVGTRTLLGPAYEFAHLIVFVLGTPALINLLVLTDPAKPVARFGYAVPASTALAFVLVLEQYAVSEALFGIDGTGGPFSAPPGK